MGSFGTSWKRPFALALLERPSASPSPCTMTLARLLAIPNRLETTQRYVPWFSGRALEMVIAEPFGLILTLSAEQTERVTGRQPPELAQAAPHPDPTARGQKGRIRGGKAITFAAFTYLSK